VRDPRLARKLAAQLAKPRARFSYGVVLMNALVVHLTGEDERIIWRVRERIVRVPQHFSDDIFDEPRRAVRFVDHE
jgi:hypothetical protein